MTEREKMLKGMLYNPADAELIEHRHFASNITKMFNNTDKSQIKERRDILKKLLGYMGENVYINQNINFDYGYNTYIGDNSYFNFNCTFLDCAEIRIGKNVFVGPNVSFFTPIHPLLSRERNINIDENGNKYILEYCKPITVGDNVWLGGGVIVNPGVSIGNDTVIGSGSVVTKDIPSGVIAAGVPCRVIREITESDSIENIFGL